MIYTNFNDIIENNKKYEILVADPPWSFKTYSKKNQDRAPENHYQCMSWEDLENMPIGEISADNAVLLMWCTDPLLAKQIVLPEKWGFTYKTVAFNWVKENKKSKSLFFGLGYITRSNSEYCLYFTKGKPKRPKVRNILKVVIAKIREHSRKPDIIRDHIDSMYDGAKIELFARSSRAGWDSFGNEVDKFD